MTTHVFWYRFARIMEDLQHEERAGGPFAIQAPEGAYLHYNGIWLERRKNKNTGGALVSRATKPEAVPREIRAMALLVT